MKKKNSGKRFGLWNRFVSIVFGIFILAGGMAYAIILTIVNTDLFLHMEFNVWFSLMLSLMLSLVIGSTITYLVGKQILTPLVKLNHASKEISNGNFRISIETDTPILEIKEIYASFNQMAEELSGIEIMRNDFVSKFSHEFKTPIAAIKGYAALLLDHESSEEEKERYIQMIIDSSNQLGSLSTSILRLSKLENQDIITDKSTYWLDEQLRQAVLYFEKDWAHKNIQFRLHLHPVKFYNNENLMMQIWLNLLSNAVKFTPANGEIEINLNQTETHVVISVKDTGIGMSEQVLRHVFDKFFQADSSGYKEGNGLGLAIVARILRMSSGTIQVNSHEGKGSEFMITLPFETEK